MSNVLKTAAGIVLSLGALVGAVYAFEERVDVKVENAVTVVAKYTRQTLLDHQIADAHHKIERILQRKAVGRATRGELEWLKELKEDLKRLRKEKKESW